MIIAICDSCKKPLSPVVDFFECTNPDCDLYGEIVHLDGTIDEEEEEDDDIEHISGGASLGSY